MCSIIGSPCTHRLHPQLFGSVSSKHVFSVSIMIRTFHQPDASGKKTDEEDRADMFASQEENQRFHRGTAIAPIGCSAPQFAGFLVTADRTTDTPCSPNIEPVIVLLFQLTCTSNDIASHVTKSDS